MNEVVVTLEHCRQLRYCAKGMRAFFTRHGLDWAGFKARGIAASIIEATGDAMGIAAANLARQQVGAP